MFAGSGNPSRPITWEWRLIRRKRRPFLLLPVTVPPVVGLKLYSPQRPRAKIVCSLFPWLLNTPAAGLFEGVRFQADADAEFLRFLAEQSAVDPSCGSAPVIKFGLTEDVSRLVLLVCDETQRPASVVKVGLGPAGRRATDREADLLAQLPPDTVGCIRLTGRYSSPDLSAFATAYFPGSSPTDDTGLEHLFTDWLNPGTPVPIESLTAWGELEEAFRGTDPENWQIVRSKLAGLKLRTSLYHGDFTPWNVRSVNMRNIQAFDWERGSLQGIPGWDWFHFIVQTAVLARRLSVERVAAEIEQVLHSERFEKYAREAGITHLVHPLFLAYLLHQKRVVKPLEGVRATRELFKLLSARWEMTPPQHRLHHYHQPTTAPGESGWASAVRQWQFAGARLGNLFWEPSLNARRPPTLAAQWRAHWGVILMAGLLMAGAIWLHGHMNPHLGHLPFYLLPCALATWRAGRRWGMIFALIATVAGPLIKRVKDPDFHAVGVVVWSMILGFMMLQMCVMFLDRLLQQRKRAEVGERLNGHSGQIADHWAVVLACGLWLAGVIALQVFASPHLGFLPLYLIPCLVLTLTVGRTWSLVAATLVAAVGPFVQRFGDPDYLPTTVELWNTLTRFVVLLILIVLLDQLLRKNILFFPSPPPTAPNPDGLKG
jgi:hypothetical protein